MSYKINKEVVKYIIEDNRGTVLFMTLLMLTSALTAVLVSANIINVGIKMSGTQERSTVAYFADEAGAERVLWEIRKNNFTGCSDNDFCVKFDADGTGINGCDASCDDADTTIALSNNASYKVKYNDDGSTITLTSFGSYENARRVVEVSYRYGPIEICDNNINDDPTEDNDIDCADSDCPDCSDCFGGGKCFGVECKPPEPSETGLCDDGINNDCDGKTDCADLDCASDPVCLFCGEAGEHDMIVEDEKECNQCDHDGDDDDDQLGWGGAIADICDSNCGIVSFTVQQFEYESPETTCNDGKDNDCDGDVDCDDTNCQGGVEISCFDGIDNDCDGDVDCDDPDCYGDPGPGGYECCDNVSDCTEYDCVIESCGGNQCVYNNRAKCAQDECGEWYCDAAGPAGDCIDPDDNSDRGEIVCEDCANKDHPFTESWPFESGIPSCCGDDTNEYYITIGEGQPACCDSAGDCVDSGGDCRTEWSGETTCNDGIDNDCDGNADCADPDCDCDDCGGGNKCIGGVCKALETPEFTCGDTYDNDCDGSTDCADPDCDGLPGPGGDECCDNALEDCKQDDCVEELCAGNQCVYNNRAKCAQDECGEWYCDAAGPAGDCIDPDDNSDRGEIVCEDCANKDHPFTESWPFEGGTPSCCGDDANEYYITIGEGQPACCDSAGDCVDSLGVCRTERSGGETTCDDFIDNDCDSYTDCNDPSCTNSVSCPETCDNGIDDDADSLVDCADEECNCKTTIYITTIPSDGNLGGRIGADNFCVDNKPGNLSSSVTCFNTHAFISISGTDFIGDMWDNYNYDANDIVYWWDDSSLTWSSFSSDWSGMWDGSILPSQADGTGNSSPVWTGSNDNGTRDNNHCQGWTNNTNKNGRTGSPSAVDGKWLEDVTEACDQTRNLRCVTSCL